LLLVRNGQIVVGLRLLLKTGPWKLVRLCCEEEVAFLMVCSRQRLRRNPKFAAKMKREKTGPMFVLIKERPVVVQRNLGQKCTRLVARSPR
jgi:hypothetical protein